jgi:hypothetical protein
MTGTMDEVYDRVANRGTVFKTIPSTISNKFLRTIVDDEVKNGTITKNLKLVSFELISRALENPNTTEMIDKRKLIEKVFSSERETTTAKSMKKALEMAGVFLEEASIDFLYI